MAPPKLSGASYLDREGTRPYTTVDWCVTSGRTISDEGLSLPDVSELVKPDADSGPDDFLGWEYQTENDGKKLFHPDYAYYPGYRSLPPLEG